MLFSLPPQLRPEMYIGKLPAWTGPGGTTCAAVNKGKIGAS